MFPAFGARPSRFLLLVQVVLAVRQPINRESREDEFFAVVVKGAERYAGLKENPDRTIGKDCHA